MKTILQLKTWTYQNSTKTKVISFSEEITGINIINHKKKSVLVSSPGKDGFINLLTKSDRKTAPRENSFGGKITRTKPQPKRIFLGSSPSDNSFVAWKLSTSEERSLSENYIGGEITGKKVNMKTVLGSIPCENSGFTDNFCHTELQASTDKTSDKLSGNKD